jgi:RNA polymerase sigma-70 factor (ECF subfamily)
LDVSSIQLERLPEPSAPDDPVAQVLEGQSTPAALALVAELPPDQAEVVATRVLGGLAVAEVARIVGNALGRSRCWPIAACGGWPSSGGGEMTRGVTR